MINLSHVFFIKGIDKAIISFYNVKKFKNKCICMKDITDTVM